MLNRAKDPRWVEEEYAKLMGPEALMRQKRAHREGARRSAGIKCECGWKGPRAEVEGPHHSESSCPMYREAL